MQLSFLLDRVCALAVLHFGRRASNTETKTNVLLSLLWRGVLLACFVLTQDGPKTHAQNATGSTVLILHPFPLTRLLCRCARSTDAVHPAVPTTTHARPRSCSPTRDAVQLTESLRRRLVVQIRPPLLRATQQRVRHVSVSVRRQFLVRVGKGRSACAASTCVPQELLDGGGTRRGWQVRII